MCKKEQLSVCKSVKLLFEKFFSQEPARLTKIVTSRRGGTPLSYRVRPRAQFYTPM